MSFFQVTHEDKHTRARTGIITTDHGTIETPIFMPVGTQATVKTLDVTDLKNIDAQIILANTYHLHLRPGEDLIADAGGLHKFMAWDGPILTDSGGFQVLSLGLQKERKNETENSATEHNAEALVKIDDDGVTFRSHIDGSVHRFTPEIAIDIEHKLGADIIMAFDECTPDDADLDYAKKALTRTHEWAERSLAAHKKNTSYHGYHQFLFGIVQGAQHKELRELSAQTICNMDFDGIAIGGESVGYNMEATKEILDWVHPILPKDKPHYAMGLGYSPMDLFEVVERGIDMFDCVAPTRIARNGTLFSREAKKQNYRLNINNAVHRTDMRPIDEHCDCFTCKHHTRSYLHHLFKAQELLAYRLATIHNLHFFLSLMKDMREAIKEDRFRELKAEWS